VKRLPIRVRVAAAFAVAMAIVLTATGAYVYARLGSDMNHSLDQDLRVRSDDLSALVAGGGSLARESAGRLVERGESFGQVINPRGGVVDASRTLGSRPLLDPSEVRRALRRAMFVDRASVTGLNEPARVLATPIVRGGHRLVLAVGATKENKAEALRSLRTELLVAGPVALVVAIGLGYVLAGVGLRAVEAMRRRAEAISADRPGERLPVPATGDELERLGTTLNEMLARLQDALDRERDFVAEAGHELRTPLALLRAELDFALHHADTEQELREALREASAETDRLVQLSGDLLLIASSDRGGLALQVEKLRVRDLLESVRNRFSWRAMEDGRSLVIDAPEEMELTGDRLRLEQALGNLVDNALRHGEGTVHIAAQASDAGIELVASDEGAGFPDGRLDHAFERFSRGDHGRSRGGAGLGLAIVDSIARAHGGAARAANGPGGGARVRILVPAEGPSPSGKPEIEPDSIAGSRLHGS
jgi:two-component system, OmpR family, sensor kinase